MPIVARTALLPFGTADLYAMVGDVESYPAFVPGCVSARIEQGEGELIQARLGFRVRGLEDSFVTRNRMEPARSIHIEMLEGPFRQLRGSWSFLPLDERASKVRLDMSVDFGSRVLESVLAPWIDRAVNDVLDAFTSRAKVLYEQG